MKFIKFSLRCMLIFTNVNFTENFSENMQCDLQYSAIQSHMARIIYYYSEYEKIRVARETAETYKSVPMYPQATNWTFWEPRRQIFGSTFWGDDSEYRISNRFYIYMNS